MTRNQKKEKLKHKKEVQKLKKKYISGSKLAIFIQCEECKYRHECKRKHTGRDITACSEGIIDLNIIRGMLRRSHVRKNKAL